MEWSEYQKNVFTNVSKGQGHTVIEAVAGAGKTSVIIESLNYIPDNISALLVAFNKKIADELKRRASSNFNVEIKTLHSVGFKTCKRRWPNIDLDNEKVSKILNSLVGKDRKLNDVKYQMRKCISLCKACMVSESEEIDLIIDAYDIDVCDMQRETFINFITFALLKCYEITTHLDFDDMLWLVHMYDLPCQQYDYIFIDESQDLNESQLKLALASCKKDGRIFMVGDPKQAIYIWNGASADVMSRTLKELKANKLPLSITYRCPTSVVSKAKQYCKQIEAAPDAPKGTVDYMAYKKMLKDAKPGCFILSRTNAPLIKIAMNFIKKDVPCNIQGRDLGANLQNMIKKSRRKRIDSFLEWLKKWEGKEIKRRLEKGRPIMGITDKAACLRALADGCNSIQEMKGKITELFDDQDDHDVIMCSSIHKSKGLERPTVYLLNSSFFGNSQVEKHVRYVGITRAMDRLVFVNGLK